MQKTSDVEKRRPSRVEFSHGVDVQIVAIDGTWSRSCKMIDISQAGAKLLIETSIEDPGRKEFFLVLSTRGVAYRRCELAWVNGEQIGVRFLGTGVKKRWPAKRSPDRLA